MTFLTEGPYMCYCGRQHYDGSSGFCPECRRNITLNGIRASTGLLTAAEVAEVQAALEKRIRGHYRYPSGIVMAPALTGSPDLYPRRFPVVDKAVATPMAEVPAKLAEMDARYQEDDPLYRSGWYIGTLPASASLSAQERDEYSAWREGRKKFVTTFSDADKEEMLSHVTPVTIPPLASDIARLSSGPVRSSEKINWPKIGTALALGIVAAVLLGLGFWASAVLFFIAALFFGLKQ